MQKTIVTLRVRGLQTPSMSAERDKPGSRCDAALHEEYFIASFNPLVEDFVIEGSHFRGMTLRNYVAALKAGNFVVKKIRFSHFEPPQPLPVQWQAQQPAYDSSALVRQDGLFVPHTQPSSVGGYVPYQNGTTEGPPEKE